ncbi:MAG: 2-oxoacid:acceptor oxidoreductase subunit alpha [Candidatus Bathyarchaeia archaeon]
MKINNLSFLIGGEAGAGITRSGFLFAKACMRAGLNVFGTNDYQSLIRGGHNFYVVQVKEGEVYSQTDNVDLLLTLNAETIMLHIGELVTNGGIIYDPDDNPPETDIHRREDLNFYPVPLKKIVWEELKEAPIMRNTVALGAAFALLHFDLRILDEVLRDTFRQEVAESNMKAAKRGYDYARQNFRDDFPYALVETKTAGKSKILVSGNEAVGLGALKAGCKFFAAYPMTPTTGLLHFMAENERKMEMLVIQPEGEIAAINMAAGASFAGVRAMTTTSGGGFCLMSEGLGMTGMTETPLVIMVGQRPGPSTGLPTYSAQGDLRFIIHASQGEFPRVVIAPGDVEECFYETMRAFNWAEKYQMPVILLTDKYLAESQASVEPFDVNRVNVERGDLITGKYDSTGVYMRYKITETGVSPRALPLTIGAIVRTNADEHDETGYTSEDPQMTSSMVEKRLRKLEYLARELEEKEVETVKLYGSEEATSTIVSLGGTKGPIREALKILNNVSLNYLQIIYLHPFPVKKVEEALSGVKKIIVVEHNKTSQLSSIIRERLLRNVDHAILKYDGRPFNPGYLAAKIREVL